MTRVIDTGKIAGQRSFLLTIACAAAILAAAHLTYAMAKNKRYAKRITPTFSDSECIGDVSDAVCAVETWIGCYARAEPKLCARLGVRGMKFEAEGRADVFEYIVVSILTAKTRPPSPDTRERKLLHPEHIEIRVMMRWGDLETIDRYSFSPQVYYLKSVANAWQLAAWTNDVSVTCYYAEAETPPCKLYFYDEDTPWVHDRSLHRKYP